TYSEFKQALSELKSKGMERLIIDLKDNPGGYLDRATKIADELLDGNKMIVYTDGKDGRYDSEIRANVKGEFEKGPVIVLINEGSASASEIVSGALQDNDRALIVGRRSFGKGLVQMPIPLSDGSELRLTISRYYTPCGRSIQKPYNPNNTEDYNSDLLKRYQHGEFFHADSIHFIDSLKYKTLTGRTVYGGGGIMPDIFVPRDTSAYTNYLIELFNRNIVREYTLDYYSTHKDELSSYTLEEFRKNFVVTEQMLKDFVTLASKSGVVYKEREYRKSKEFLKVNLKAYIARSVWGNKGFYPIINEADEVFIQAMKHFDKAKQLEKAMAGMK
ncbi:MAG TPA: S41 family peptidase, partial [Cytophagaceae bacterium]